MSTSEPDDFDPPEDLICTNTPMPPNTKKCCETCYDRYINLMTGVRDCSSCPCHTPSPEYYKDNNGGFHYSTPTPEKEKCGHEGNYSACLCGTYDALLEGVVDTPSLDKSEHDGTCRTPECYEKRPTPAVEKCNCLHSHLACQYNNPPCHTPAVEDWEKEVWSWITKEMPHKHADRFIPLFEIIISLRESDRKRIVEGVIEDYSSWLDKNGYMDSDWYTEEPRETEAYLKSKSYQAFITNLK